MESGGQQISGTALSFDYDRASGDIKVQESPVLLKNET